jgi:hypothetical protein
MAEDKLVTLARRLHKQTKAGSVEWEKTGEDGVFEADFAGYAVQLSEVVEDEPIYFVRIYNRDEVLLEEFSDEDLTEVLNRTSPTEPSVMFELMAETYRKARRAAMGVDKAVDSIISALGAE